MPVNAFRPKIDFGNSQTKRITAKTLLLISNFGLHFGLTHIFAPFTVIFIVLRKLPLLFVKQKMRLPTGSKITDREILEQDYSKNMANI